MSGVRVTLGINVFLPSAETVEGRVSMVNDFEFFLKKGICDYCVAPVTKQVPNRHL